MIGQGKIALWLDDKQDSLDTYKQHLKECFGDKISVVAEIPLEELPDMIERIQLEPSLVALILDERLKSTGKIKYTGIELAEAIRRTDSKIPIYMLTGFSDDIGELSYQVEYVLEKDKLREPSYKKEVTARVRRHADIYQDILSQRETRFEELLRKSIGLTLTNDELTEFNDLDFWRSKAILSKEEPWAENLKQELDEKIKLLGKMQNTLRNERTVLSEET